VNLVAAVGIEPSSPLQVRKLFIPRSDKNYKNDGNAEMRYTAGTWDTSLALSVISLFAGQAQLTFSKPLSSVNQPTFSK
jgi:transposase